MAHPTEKILGRSTSIWKQILWQIQQLDEETPEVIVQPPSAAEQWLQQARLRHLLQEMHHTLREPSWLRNQNV